MGCIVLKPFNVSPTPHTKYWVLQQSEAGDSFDPALQIQWAHCYDWVVVFQLGGDKCWHFFPGCVGSLGGS